MHDFIWSREIEKDVSKSSNNAKLEAMCLNVVVLQNCICIYIEGVLKLVVRK